MPTWSLAASLAWQTQLHKDYCRTDYYATQFLYAAMLDQKGTAWKPIDPEVIDPLVQCDRAGEPGWAVLPTNYCIAVAPI